MLRSNAKKHKHGSGDQSDGSISTSSTIEMVTTLETMQDRNNDDIESSECSYEYSYEKKTPFIGLLGGNFKNCQRKCGNKLRMYCCKSFIALQLSSASMSKDKESGEEGRLSSSSQKSYVWIFKRILLLFSLVTLWIVTCVRYNEGPQPFHKKIYPMNVHISSQDNSVMNLNYTHNILPTSTSTSTHTHNKTLLPTFFDDENYKSKLRDNTDDFEVGDCKAMGQWQLEIHPSCNMLHEINERSNNYLETRLLGSGSYRDTWLIHWNGVAYAMKTLVSEDDVSARNLERHRRDSVAMSVLSPSIHIPNIYAYCGDSGIFDYSHRGDMHSIIRDVHKSERGEMWSSEEMLRYAWQVSAALSDVHGVGNIHGSPAIAHTDIDADQFLWMDGMFKLNDFNRVRFIRWNEVQKEPCKFYIGHAPGSSRSPEEYIAEERAHNKTNKNEESLTPKLDVYALGNIFYHILMKERVFRNYHTEEAQSLVQKGIFPTIPQEKRSRFTKMEMSIVQAMAMCHVYNVDDRSSAKDVEIFLHNEMKRFNVSLF